MANPNQAATNADPFSDRRAYPRIGVALPAVLQGNGERHPVQLLDVSAGGARLDCAAQFAVGTAVMLDCGGLARAAVVRWQDGRVMGVKFNEELEERVVSALIDRSDALAALMKTRA